MTLRRVNGCSSHDHSNGHSTSSRLTWQCSEQIQKNTAYGRHWISWLMRIVAPIPKQIETERNRQKLTEVEKKKHYVLHVMCHVSRLILHVLCVICHMSLVTFHLSLTPIATATYPPPANSPTMHRRLVFKDQKNWKIFQKIKQKNIEMVKKHKNV